MKINIPALKAMFFSSRVASGEQEGGDSGILDHIEKIVEISQKYGIDKCRSKGKRHFDYVCQKLGVSPVQAVLFSHFMERSEDNHIQISEIAESIQCSKVRIIKYINECDELEKKRLVRCSRETDHVYYRVPREVQDSLRKFGEYRPQKNENISIDNFFTVLEQLFQERADNELNYENLKAELLDLIRMNMHLLFCKKITSYKMDEDDTVLLICFCHLAGNNNDDSIRAHDYEFLYENKSRINSIKRELANGSHTLIEAKFVEYNNEDGFVNNESFKVSDMAKKELLSELTGLGKKDFKKNLILAASIREKKMFYNAKDASEIQKLRFLLREENYRKIQERLDGKGMRKGFACLFSGGPGTGKTETAYQIARETGRNILFVDISQTKSCWYGESEKKIKEVFDSYRTAVENSEIAPILLFNEADAVIGKRKATGENSRAVDQTENTIQNIILQEMETLEGILIATTNLSQNMDSAFERRFLYKISFTMPGFESRKGIWQSMLPGLPEDVAGDLSRQFDLSGGQIENITRKFEVDQILSGTEISREVLVKYCREETENTFVSSKRIGFMQE